MKILFWDKKNKLVISSQELIPIQYIKYELLNPEEKNPNNFKIKKELLGEIGYKNSNILSNNWSYYCMKSDLEIYEITL